MTRVETVGDSGRSPAKDPQSVFGNKRALPLDLEELDQRLESALLSVSGFHTDEPCVWACSCFLVDGSLP